MLNNLITEAAEILADAEPVVIACIPSKEGAFVICRIFGRLTLLQKYSPVLDGAEMRIVSTITEAREVTQGQPFGDLDDDCGLDEDDFPLYPRD